MINIKMKKLFVIVFLFTCICALPQNPVNIQLDVHYKNVPKEYNLDYSPAIQPLKNQFRNIPIQKSSLNLNPFADDVFNNLGALIQKHLEPLALPDMDKGFKKTVIIPYSGQIKLSNGQMHNLSTIHRGGDVFVTYSTSEHGINVTIPIAFDQVSFSYDYSAKLMGLGPTGGIVGTVNGMTVEVKIGFNTKHFVASSDFNIISVGHISFHFTGHALVDWIVNTLSEVVTSILHVVIRWVLENSIDSAVSSAVDEINKSIQKFLNPTTSEASSNLILKALL